MTQTYTPTLMEKLLGRNYKWWYLIIHNFKSTTVYRVSSLAFIANSGLGITATMFVWWINSQNGSEIFTFPEIFTYFLIGYIFNSIFDIRFHWDMSRNIRTGELNNKLLNSSNLWLQFFFREVGYKIFWNIDLLVWILIALISYQFLIIPNSINLVFLFLIAGLVLIQSIFLSIIVGALAFFTINNFGFVSLFEKVSEVASSKLFPLNLVKFTYFLTFTPFAYFFHHPCRSTSAIIQLSRRAGLYLQGWLGA